MKKTICAIILASFTYVPFASAEMGVNVGVSGQAGIFGATAKEVSTERTSTGTEIAGVAYPSVFIEKSLGDKMVIGVDYMPDALSSDTVETTKLEHQSGGTDSNVTNNLQVDFEGLTTAYVGFNITDSAYIKAGFMTVDVLTKENLGTGGSYGDTSLDGAMFGFGVHNQMDNLFWRLEANYLEFDGVTVSSTNSDNSVSVNSLDGLTAKISIGTSF
tara:strand:- start:430 stop:1077 length:648 start_codon:yes stop_codon:yes gene_type:complete